MNLTLAANYHLGGLRPETYHGFNIVVHALSAVLLWAIVRGTLRLPYFDDKFAHVADPLALLVALVWSVHSRGRSKSIPILPRRTPTLATPCRA